MPVYQNHVYVRFKKRLIPIQYAALRAANHVLIRSYYALGHLTAEQRDAQSMGRSFFKPVCDDPERKFPGIPNFPVRNPRNIHQFYRIYSGGRKLQPLAGETINRIENQNYQNKSLNQTRFRRCVPERFNPFRSFSLRSGLISRHIAWVRVPATIIPHLPLETS